MRRAIEALKTSSTLMDFTIEPRNFRADVEKRCLNLENTNRMGRLAIKIWVKRSESIRNRLQKDMRRR